MTTTHISWICCGPLLKSISTWWGKSTLRTMRSMGLRKPLKRLWNLSTVLSRLLFLRESYSAYSSKKLVPLTQSHGNGTRRSWNISETTSISLEKDIIPARRSKPSHLDCVLATAERELWEACYQFEDPWRIKWMPIILGPTLNWRRPWETMAKPPVCKDILLNFSKGVKKSMALNGDLLEHEQ